LSAGWFAQAQFAMIYGFVYSRFLAPIAACAVGVLAVTCTGGPAEARPAAQVMNASMEEPGRWMPMRLEGAPRVRYLHTAVWTGKEMIVWGGVGPEGDPSLGDGARYDPITDRWQPVNTTNAPSPRAEHTALWTGSEMIVWGGWRTGGPRGDGARYNPATDSWTPLPPSPLTPRTNFSAVWTGTAMIVWGGYGGVDGQAAYFNDGARYVPDLDHWVAVNADGAPGARLRHTAVWTGSEMIVWGGSGERSRAPGDAASYDPQTDTWRSISLDGAPRPKDRHTAVWTGSEMLIWGGPGPNGYLGVGDGGRYNPASDSWAPISMDGAPSARADHTMVWDGREALIWGGQSRANNGPNYRGPSPLRSDAGRYDPSTDTWAAIPSEGAPHPRQQHTAVWTGAEMIVWGGSGAEYFTDAARYSPP